MLCAECGDLRVQAPTFCVRVRLQLQTRGFALYVEGVYCFIFLVSSAQSKQRTHSVSQIHSAAGWADCVVLSRCRLLFVKFRNTSSLYSTRSRQFYQARLLHLMRSHQLYQNSKYWDGMVQLRQFENDFNLFSDSFLLYKIKLVFGDRKDVHAMIHHR